MRGKYKRKKQRKDTLARTKASVSPRMDQELTTKPQITKDRSEDKVEPMSFIKLIKDDPRFRVEVAAVSVGLLVLAVYGFQLAAMLKSNRLTRESIRNTAKQFQIDQRPYVWDNNVINPANVKIVAGQRMWINLSLINFGKAPALNSRGIAKIFTGEGAMHDADDWFASIGDKPFVDDPNDTGIVVPPGIPNGEITEKSAFGGGGYFTAMSDKVLTKEDVEYITHTNEKIAIVVHVQYFDAYGTRYWSNFCLSRFDTGVYPNCQKHNEMH